MNTRHLYPAAVVPLHSPWWQRALQAWAQRPRRTARPAQPEAAVPQTWHRDDLWSLRGLSAATLRDIGAPEWVHESRDQERSAALDLLRL